MAGYIYSSYCQCQFQQKQNLEGEKSALRRGQRSWKGLTILITETSHHVVESIQGPTPPLSKSSSLAPWGSVNDLFNPLKVDSDTAVQAEEDDTTIKNIAKCNVSRREPWILPSRYNQLTTLEDFQHLWSHISGFPLPLSPEYTGASYNSFRAGDCEVNFSFPFPFSPLSSIFHSFKLSSDY